MAIASTAPSLTIDTPAKSDPSFKLYLYIRILCVYIDVFFVLHCPVVLAPHSQICYVLPYRDIGVDRRQRSTFLSCLSLPDFGQEYGHQSVARNANVLLQLTPEKVGFIGRDLEG